MISMIRLAIIFNVDDIQYSAFAFFLCYIVRLLITLPQHQQTEHRQGIATSLLMLEPFGQALKDERIF